MNMRVTHNLADHAVLAHLSIKQWSAHRYDKAESHDVNQRNGAAHGTARVNKRLISKAALAKLRAIASAADVEHRKRTSPWGVRGLAILPVVGFMDYRDAMNKFAGEFDQARYEFSRIYPSERADAQQTLAGLFKAEDYPEPGEVMGRFSFGVRFMPVPTSGDFRVALHDDYLAEIREEVEASTKKATTDAVRVVYERAEGVLSTLAETLAGYEPAQAKGERTKGVFRDSLVENVREMARLLPALNVFGDPTIAELATRIAKIVEFDAKDLRESDAMRAATIASATATIADIRAATQGYF